MQKEIVEFVKKGTQRVVVNGKSKRIGGKRVGVLIAQRNGDRVEMGWSKANVNHGDTFDQNNALAMARARMGGFAIVPSGLLRTATAFRGRCARYFKDTSSLFTLTSYPSPSSAKTKVPKVQRGHKSLAEWEKELNAKELRDINA